MMSKITDEEFIAYVERAETAAPDNINSYKVKRALFAVLGYFVIFCVVAILFLLVGGTVGIPDNYQFMDKKLIELLENKVPALVN